MVFFLFSLLCSAGVGFLFWQLMASDRTTAETLRARVAHEAVAPASEPRD